MWRYISFIVRRIHGLSTHRPRGMCAIPLRGLSFLGLHVVIGEVRGQTTDQDDSVDGDAAGGLVGLVVRGRGVGGGGLGDRVVGLPRVLVSWVRKCRL